MIRPNRVRLPRIDDRPASAAADSVPRRAMNVPRQKHQRRVRRSLLGAIHEDRHRQQGQRRGVEHQKQNLRVTGSVFAGIELLQRTHGFEADRRGCVIQPQGIGSKVEGNQTQRRMARRDFRHQAQKQWPEHLGQPVDDACLFRNTQKAQPQGQRTEQQHHHLDRQLGHGEDAFDPRCRPPAIAPARKSSPRQKNQATGH